MTSQTRSSEIRMKRCAVCKIDLKGRFVYADDKAEQLLGYTIEELFGQPLIDFLEEEDHEIVERIIAKRNHYETSFDSARVRLIGHDGRPIPARVIMSLNFIAGSPVNFQLIIDTETTSELIDSESSYQELLESLLTASGLPEWSELVAPLSRFSGAEQLLVYRVNDNSLELLEELEKQSAQAAPSIGSLHYHVASTGEEYSFTSEASIQRAVESDGVAPNEYVSRLELAGAQPFLIRFVFRSDRDRTSAARGVARARLAVELIQRLLGYTANESAGVAPLGFTMPIIESLSRLGIGLLQIGADGCITAYNSVFSSCYAGSRLEGSYEEFIELLADNNPPDIIKRILVYLQTCRERRESKGLRFTITLPSGSLARIGVLSSSASPSNHSLWLVLIPLRLFATPGSSQYHGGSVVRAIVQELRSFVSAASDVADKLEHEHHTRLTPEGDFDLQCLRDHISILENILAELSHFLGNVGDIEDLQVTDLQVLVRHLISELSTAYPSLRVDSKVAGLPKILTYRNRMTTILRDILSNSFRFARNEIEVQVSATMEDNTCCIRIAYDGPGIPRDSLAHVFDFSFTGSVPDAQGRIGNCRSLALTRELVHSMGGDIEPVSKEDKGMTVTVTIPAEQVEADKP